MTIEEMQPRVWPATEHAPTKNSSNKIHLIQLAYKQVIDISAVGQFERNILNDSYDEYLVQVQTFALEKKYTSWQELRTAIPKANLNVQYKTGFAIGLYVRELGGRMPGLTDTLGRFNLPFEEHTFNILESDVMDKSQHKVSITYVTPYLVLLGTLGNNLWLATQELQHANPEEGIETFTLKLLPDVSIIRWKLM